MLSLETLTAHDSWNVQQLGLVARFFHVVRNPADAVLSIAIRPDEELHRYFGEPVGTYKTREAELIDPHVPTVDKAEMIAQHFRPAAQSIILLSRCSSPVYEYIDLTDQYIAKGLRPELNAASVVLPDDEILFDMFDTLAAERQKRCRQLEGWLASVLIDSLVER